jgi:hypothetical protein
MSESLTIELQNRQQAWQAMETRLFPYLKLALQGGHQYVLSVKQAKRSNEQNKRLWAMLNEISQQVDWYGQKLTPEEWKDVFSAAMKRTKVVPGLDGGFVVCGQSTSRMTKGEMSEMQTLMEAFGAERGVKFSAVE